MPKAIIVDDEEGGRRVLELLLKEHCPQVQLAASCSNGIEAVQAVRREKPDLLFMDIDMPGLTGFDVLDLLKDLKLKVIFVTAHDQHAIRAFKYLAVDYLLKPVSGSALAEAVQKAEQLDFRTDSAQMDPLMRQLEQKEKLPEVIALPMSYGLEMTRIADIMYCKADRNYTHVFRHGKEKVLVTRQLKEFESMLAPHGFFRVHHSALINLKFVSRFIKSEGGHIEMQDGGIIEISRLRKEEFLGMMQRL